MREQRPRLLGVGGAHVDRRGRVSGAHVAGASNPGVMAEDVGGGTFNALRAAVQRGVGASLLSVRGGDLAGEIVARAIAQSGLDDLSAVFLDRATASYTALLDEHGDVITALADMGLYDVAFPRQMRRSKLREAIAAHDAVLCDANLPAAALAALFAAAAAKPIFAIAISPAKAVRLAGLLDQVTLLFMNRREAASLCGLTVAASAADLVDALRGKGLRGGVITAGAGAVVVFCGDQIFEVDPPPAEGVSDVTGAGDALSGATVAALMRGLPLAEAVREGIAAAFLTIMSRKAATQLTEPEFGAVLARVPAPLSRGTG